MSVLTQLEGLLGADGVRTDADGLRDFGLDWSRVAPAAPLAIAFPRNVEQAQAIVRLARGEGLALVPSGGRTGLSGGAVAADGELVVSFDRMNAISDFNPVDRTVEVGAGVVTARLQQFAKSKGLFYPVDFASSGSSQIGGNIATNAGGIRVLRYGLTRDWVAGLTVVTGTGEVLELNNGLVKNATGYDLRHLFAGSEGTLGFIASAIMRLTNPPEQTLVALLALPRMTDLTSILAAFREGLTLDSFEFFSGSALDHVLPGSGLPEPFKERSPYYVVMEFEAHQPDAEEITLAAWGKCLDKGWATDGHLSHSERQKAQFWQYRERISEAISRHSPYKNDLAVTPSAVPEFLLAVEAVVGERYPDYEIIWFGHIGDGNLHLNILKPEALELAEFRRHCEAVSEQIMRQVQRFGGSISAEHGVGLLKKAQLRYTRSEAEIRLMRAVKQAFDPDGIMNPGKLLP